MFELDGIVYYIDFDEVKKFAKNYFTLENTKPIMYGGEVKNIELEQDGIVKEVRKVTRTENRLTLDEGNVKINEILDLCIDNVLRFKGGVHDSEINGFDKDSYGLSFNTLIKYNIIKIYNEKQQ